MKLGALKDGEGQGTGGGSIIAGGLMRRHNCTIIDDRFIRRPGPPTGTPDPSKTQKTPLPLSHIIMRRTGAARGRYVKLARNDNYRGRS